MTDFGPHSNWAHFQERWFDCAQRVKTQWPEISFSAILAIQGSREQLCRCVATTYGLSEGESDRAVAIWQIAQLEPGRSDESTAFTPATPAV